MTSRVPTRQVREIWFQELEHKQVPKSGTVPGVRKSKRSLLARHTRRKCSMKSSQLGESQGRHGRQLDEESGKPVSTITAHANPLKTGMEPGVRRGKCSLLVCPSLCKCSMDTTHNTVKVKHDIKVMKLMLSLIGVEVKIGQGSECHLTFARGRLHIVE